MCTPFTESHRKGGIVSEVPYLLDLEQMLAWANARGRPLSRDEIEGACARIGRMNAPALLGMLHEWQLLEEEAYHAAGAIWSMAEYPDRSLTRTVWREIFGRAGYCIDGVPAERPSEPLTLYRGAPREYRLNWSWTDSSEVATDFASGRLWTRPASTVWFATVEPWRLLSRDNGRKEAEYVIDTRGLRPTELT